MTGVVVVVHTSRAQTRRSNAQHFTWRHRLDKREQILVDR
jgi:hypothetical protein